MSILLSYKITVTAYSAKRVFNQIYGRKNTFKSFQESGITLFLDVHQSIRNFGKKLWISGKYENFRKIFSFFFLDVHIEKEWGTSRARIANANRYFIF